ncbi:MAG: hypothetical protein GYA58_02190 [Anaerolineaceae bacterium]|nr:hypothetical protein [Anaerolineaceae bacterium]
MKTKRMLLTILVLSLIALSFTACEKVNKTLMSTDLYGLLINTNDLPQGWLENYVGHAVDVERGKDSAGITVYTEEHPNAFGCVEEIYRFQTVNEAKHDYEYAVQTFGYNNEDLELSFTSKKADESHFSCQSWPDIPFPVCYWVARYNILVVSYRVWLEPGYITIDDTEAIVQKIDNRVSKLLSK